jgi:hypothetical protein
MDQNLALRNSLNQPGDVLLLRGAFQMVLKDLNGSVLQKQLVDNLVVTAGRAWVLKQLESTDNVASQVISHMAIGSGTIAPVTGNTGLGNEVTRKAISSINAGNTTANPPNIQFECSFASNEGNTTIGEVGMFNSSAVGTMFARATIASFVKATSNTFALSYIISA